MQNIIETLHQSRKMGESGGRWLNAHENRSAGLSPLSSRCIALCDISGTKDNALIVVEPRFNTNDDILQITGRLRTYRGAATLHLERPLPNAPSNVVSFFNDDLEPRIPAVAVAVGTNILIFKNNKPFFKWSVPPIELTALEEETWRQLVTADGLNMENLQEHVTNLRSITFSELSSRSQHLLILAAQNKENSVLEEFIGRYVHAGPPIRITTITCMGILQKTSNDKDSSACIVAATEIGQLFILDPVAFTPLQQTAAHRGTGCTTAPFNLVCSGLYDVEFRCWVALRDGSVWLVRRGWLEGRRWCCAPHGSNILDLMVLHDDTLVLALTDGRLVAWNKRAKILWTITTKSVLSSVCLVALPHLNTCLIAAGINNQLQLFENRTLVDSIQLPDRPTAVQFGRLGQEDNVLVIITQDGSLLLKILKRTAEFNSPIASNSGANAIANKPLPLPKRSKLFAEQAQRERNFAPMMHQLFQQGLIRLRLTAARQTFNIYNTLNKNISDNVLYPIKLSAQVLGLGPKFTLTLTVENLSAEKHISNLNVLLHTLINKYRIDKSFFMVPLIPPEASYKIETSVVEILQDDNLKDANEDFVVPIRIFVVDEEKTHPVLAATINMPPTDPLAFLI